MPYMVPPLGARPDLRARIAVNGVPSSRAVRYSAGVSQTGYSRTFWGLPSRAEASQTRRLPQPAADNEYGSVTSNVPRQPGAQGPTPGGPRGPGPGAAGGGGLK